MTFQEWFDLHRNLAVTLAKAMSVTVPAVHQWASNGVPLERMEGVQAFTGRAVKVAEMVAENTELRRRRRAEIALPEGNGEPAKAA